MIAKLRVGAMSKINPNDRRCGGDAGATSNEVPQIESARRGRPSRALTLQLLAQTERERMRRDESARAKAALRGGDPGLESWSDPPVIALRGPRRVRLFLAALWLSIAVLTTGAMTAIAALLGIEFHSNVPK
jgi:hypothetical protein